MIETWYSQDLNSAVKVQYLNGNVFSMDNNGNKIGVNVFQDGEPVTLTGSISADVIRSDGGTVAVSGTASDNQAYVVLPQACYAVPGVISIVIKNTVSSDVTTLCAVVANVYQSSTDSVVDPGTIIPSVQTLISQIETAVASIPADYSSLWTSLAPAFSSSTSYQAGQYVTYNGGVYRFTTAHSGSWAAGDVTAVNIGGELSDVKSAIKQYTGMNLIESFSSGYYALQSSSTSINISSPTSNASYKCAYVQCSPGDIFYVTSKGTSAARNWAFLSSASGDNNIISRTTSSYELENVKITAPAGAAYAIFNVNSGLPYRIEIGERIVNRVSTLETNVQTNTNDIANLENTLDTLFTPKSVTGTGEVIGEFEKIVSASVGSAESAKIAKAQMFEAKYPGTSSQSGVSVTKNSDGTYTINGTATSGAWFYLNQETRTGTTNRVILNGQYSFGYDIVSGSLDKGTYTGSTYGIVAMIDLDNTSAQLASLSLDDNFGDVYTISNKAVAVAFRTTTGVIYNNLRIAPKLNKGAKLYPYATYKAPTTLTSFDAIVSTIQEYTPYIWVTTTPSTETITIAGKTIKTDGGESGEINLYDVLTKYNDRVDLLAQLFTKPLFLVYTDIHDANDNLLRIKEWYNKNKKTYVSDVYCLGDMVDDQATDTLSFANDDFWKSTIKVIGNHDVLVSGTIPGITEAEAYTKYMANDISGWNVIRPTGATTETYFYKDYSNKIRIIVLDTYFYTEDQHTWFVNTLADAKTNNLAVIVCQHEDICTAVEKQPLSADYPFAKKHGGFTGLQYRTYGNGGNYETKRNAVDAFIEGGGTFICWLCGHQHADMTGYYQGTHGKQLSVLLSNASNSTLSSMRFRDYSQDCFTYVSVDTTDGYIYLLRIGETTDKWFHTNLLLCYDYVNHQVVEYNS